MTKSADLKANSKLIGVKKKSVPQIGTITFIREVPKPQEALFSHFFIWSLQQPSVTYRVSFYESHREGDEKPRKAYNSLKAKIQTQGR